MKPTKEINQLKSILNQNLGVHKNNCETVIDCVVSMQKARTVNLSQMVNYSNKIGVTKSASIYKNYQRLMHKSNISQNNLARSIIAMYGLEECKLVLAMDRTNWKYGAADINLLVLSVCVLGTSIPIYWLELDSRGNSNTNERNQLMEMFIKEFGVARIDYLVADREFIGKAWFYYLNERSINFVIRIKSNMLLELEDGTVSASRLFKSARIDNHLTHEIKIDGMRLTAQATRSTESKLVTVVSNNLKVVNILPIYAKRWKIECLFGQLKTRGFNFEDTHFTIKHRLGNLMKLIVLSFVICYLIGLVGAKRHPILIKKHGRQLISYFRHGLDLMIQTLNQSYIKAIGLITLCFTAISLEIKCKKLICVMY